MSLADLFTTVGTDKGCYAAVYEMILRDRREAIRNLLEIGIGTLDPAADWTMAKCAAEHYRPGGSLRAWRDYFPNAEIVGIDTQPDTQFEEERIRTYLCNSTNWKVVKRLGLPRFDVIIDDGSHDTEDQLATLRNFYGSLVPNGFYFIEDVLVGTPLFENPGLIEKVIRHSNYFVTDVYRSEKKLIVVQAPSRPRHLPIRPIFMRH